MKIVIRNQKPIEEPELQVWLEYRGDGIVLRGGCNGENRDILKITTDGIIVYRFASGIGLPTDSDGRVSTTLSGS